MNKFLSRLSLAALSIFTPIHTCLAEDPPKYYEANWKSLKNYQVPEWYQDAKFGIWTHWGVYSVPGFRGDHAAEWYPRWMYLKEKADGKPFTDYENLGVAIMKHHRETYGDQAKFGYHDLIPMWKAEKWNPENWAQLAIDSGAKFFTITGMHHDGFALYDSAFTEWDSVEKGPKRDLVGDLATSIRAKGLKFGISNHFAHNRNYYGFYFDNGYDKAYADRPELQGLYSSGKMDAAYVERWWNITTEMVRKYNPDLYYFDWGWDPPFWKNEWPEFFSHYYNHAIRSGKGTLGNPNVLVNYKGIKGAHGAGVHDLERASMRDATSHVWQTDTSISDYSWGYADSDTFKSPAALICMLVDNTSKNGVLMLNFGPKADGTVPEECHTRLLAMGKWLRANGEAIYSTRPWTVAEEGITELSANHKRYAGGPFDIRYTRSKDSTKIYATAMGLPGTKLTLQSTKVNGPTEQGKVTMLANGRQIPFSLSPTKQLILDLSNITAENAGCEHAYSFRLEGFDIEGVKQPAYDLSKFYLTKIETISPTSKSHKSEFPYISGLTPTLERAHRGVKRDSNYHEKSAIKIGGKSYEKGLMICPAGNQGVGYFILSTKGLPEIKGLTAEVGIDDVVKTAGSSAFIVEAFVNNEWKQLYKSPVLKGGDKAQKVDVTIPKGSKFITLKTTDGGNGSSADHAVWADAKFY